ncbi:MAG: hypothetical protein AAF631_06105 [Pseudomonadota bacterium]
MKKVALAAAMTLAASTAFAGSPEPVDPPIIEVIEESGSSGNALVPILALLILAAAVAASD